MAKMSNLAHILKVLVIFLAKYRRNFDGTSPKPIPRNEKLGSAHACSFLTSTNTKLETNFNATPVILATNLDASKPQIVWSTLKYFYPYK